MDDSIHWSRRRVPPEDVFEDPGPQPELFAGLLPSETVLLLGGAGGLGKTGLTLMMAISIVTGRQLFGRYAPAKPGQVIMFLGEDNHRSARRMLKRIAEGMKLTDREREVVADLLHLVPLAGAYAKVTIRNPHTRQLLISPDVEHLVDSYRHTGHIAFISFDPGLRFHDGIESANEDGDVLIQAMNRMRQALDTTVLLVVHTNKEARGTKGDVDFGKAFRGASSLVDGARHALLMVGMSEDRAKEWSVDKAVRDRWVELVTAKANLMEKPETVVLVRGMGGVFARGLKGKTDSKALKETQLIERIKSLIELESRLGKVYSKHAFIARFAGKEGTLKAGKHSVDHAILALLESGEVVKENDKLARPKSPKSLPVPGLPDRETQNGREAQIQ